MLLHLQLLIFLYLSYLILFFPFFQTILLSTFYSFKCIHRIYCYSSPLSNSTTAIFAPHNILFKVPVFVLFFPQIILTFIFFPFQNFKVSFPSVQNQQQATYGIMYTYTLLPSVCIFKYSKSLPHVPPCCVGSMLLYPIYFVISFAIDSVVLESSRTICLHIQDVEYIFFHNDL